MYALVNGRIYTGFDIVDDYALVVERGRIAALCPRTQLTTQYYHYDVAGAIIAPGFVDLQVNGCGGVQFNDTTAAVSIATLATMQQANVQSGCTYFLPTLITSPDDLVRHAVHVMQQWRVSNPHTPLGLHLEGPWINVAKCGTHDPQLIRPPSTALVDFICSHANVINKITLAPEIAGERVIRQLVAAGICVACGHSNATWAQAKMGFSAGISLATHLYNAMSAPRAREPGVVGALYDTPEIFCGVIADGYHVHYANLRTAKQMKGDKLFLVTDATAAAGTNVSEFTFAGKTIYYRDGVCVDAQGVLSGSALTMIEAVRNCVEFVGFPLAETLRMATLYPARAIGLQQHIGSLEVGKRADIVVFSHDYRILNTIVAGNDLLTGNKNLVCTDATAR